jgi:serine/threonine protein kinase
MVGITVYWKKFMAKRPLSEGQELKFRETQRLNEESLMAFSLEEIMEATQNFSQKLGESTFGEVFFGKLPDGKEIAVKEISEFQWFLTEIDLLSRVHHKNLVTLLGYCHESGKHMLIYDYMPEGSLSHRVYVKNANWKSRLKIAIDAAEGLRYLHVCCTPMIIHRDVKTTNIILDSYLNGKLGDFGLSMMTMDRKAPIDTPVVYVHWCIDSKE